MQTYSFHEATGRRQRVMSALLGLPTKLARSSCQLERPLKSVVLLLLLPESANRAAFTKNHSYGYVFLLVCCLKSGSVHRSMFVGLHGEVSQQWWRQ